MSDRLRTVDGTSTWREHCEAPPRLGELVALLEEALVDGVPTDANVELSGPVLVIQWQPRR